MTNKIKYLTFVLGTLIIIWPSISFAGFSGSLSTSTGGIAGTGDWISDPINKPITMTWSVTLKESYWFYEYKLNVDEQLGDPGHWIIEVSPVLNNFSIVNPVPSIEDDEPKLQTEQTGNPNLPDDFFGVRFSAMQTEGSENTWSARFTCENNPVWGDFYARSGQAKANGEFNTIWNLGFTNPDPVVSPSTELDNPLVFGHILVPGATTISATDTNSNTAHAPAPGAVVLGSIGAGLVGWLRRRRAL